MTVAVDHVPIRTNAQDPRVAAVPVDVVLRAPQRRLDLPHLLDVRAAEGVHAPPRASSGWLAVAVWVRFLVAWIDGDGAGHVQSLILGAVLFNAAMVLAALGVMGDLLSGQRIMLQRVFERVRRIELHLDIPPSHYEPGARPTGQGRRHHRRASVARRHRRARGAEAVSPTVTRDAEGTVTGNTYDKYGSTNPVVKRLMAGFERTLDELWAKASPRSVLDVGCGEGVLTHKWAARAARRPRRGDRPRGPGAAGRVGQAHGAEPRVPRHEGRAAAVRRRRVRAGGGDRGARARARPRAHGGRDGARGPRRAPARVGAARAAVARAEHGPGRLSEGAGQHARAPEPLVAPRRSWSCCRGTGRSRRSARRSRGPCCSSARDHGAALRLRRGREDPLDRDRLDRRRHVRVLLGRLLRAERRRLQGHLAAVVGDVRDRLGDLPADRAAALAHDRRPARPRAGDGAPAAHAAADPGAGSRWRSWSARWRCRHRWRTGCSTASTALYWVLVVGVLAYAASYFARGWLAGHQWFALLRRARVHGGHARGCCSRWRWRSGSPRGRPRWRWASRRRRSSRWSSCRWRSPAGRGREARARAGRGGAQPGPRRALRRLRAADHGGRADAAERRRADRRLRRRPTPWSPASCSTRC